MGNSELHKDHRGRMRERLKRNGLSAFEEHEVLEMLLFSAIPRRNTNDIAHSLLDSFGDIAGVLSADKNKLCSVRGIGENAAEYLMFLGELYSDITSELFEGIPLDTEDKIGMYSVLRLGTAPADSAAAVYLGGDGVRICEEWLYRGKRKMIDSLDRYVTERAHENGAVSAILMHNHRSEPLESSPEDVIITANVRRAAEKYDILKIWHVIVADDGYRFI